MPRRSVRALSCIRLVRSRSCYGTAHGVNRGRRRKRVTLQKPSELTPGYGPIPALPGEPPPPDVDGRTPKQAQRKRVALDHVLGEVAHQLLTQRLVLSRYRQVSVLTTPL
jgi:hypothetical protein